MNTTEFWNGYAAEYGVTKKKAREACETVAEYLAKCICQEDRVYIFGLGTFKKRKKAAKRIGNVNGTGTIEIPAKEVIVFSPYEKLDEKVYERMNVEVEEEDYGISWKDFMTLYNNTQE